ncbi:Uncharacterized protein APZ42_008594, partial [Daphnia magna]
FQYNILSFNVFNFHRDLNPRPLDPYTNALPQSYDPYVTSFSAKYNSWLNG